MSKYARGTEVPVEKSRYEIERTLRRYGADEFAYAWTNERAMIVFTAHGRRVKFVLPLPAMDAFARTPGRKLRRDRDAQMRAWDQACKEKWRALALCVKAKLEAVESGITTFDQEFLPHFVLPGGETVSEYVLPRLDAALPSGELPPLLPGF